MFRVGNDILKISRIEKAVQKEHFKKSVFTDYEIKHCKSAESYAGIFCAKEAYFKALGTGIDKKLNKIEIRHDEKGKPYVKDVENCDLSISHDGEYAIATIIMW